MKYELKNIMHAAIEQLHGLQAQIEADREMLQDVYDDFELDKDMVVDLESSLFSPLQIMVMGAFSTGKSSFINALMGANLTVVGALPTTAVISKLVYGETNRVIVHFKDGSCSFYEPADFQKLTSEQEAAWRDLHKTIEYVTYEVPLELLKAINIIDSPGLDALNEYHLAATKHFIQYADTVLWVITAEAPLTSKELAYIEQLEGRMKPVVIVNKIDTIDEEEDSVDDIIADVKGKLKHRVQAVLPVSARLGLEGKLSSNALLLRESLLEDVEAYIEGNIIPHTYEYKMDKLINTINFFMLNIEASLAPYGEGSSLDLSILSRSTKASCAINVTPYRQWGIQLARTVQNYCEDTLLEGHASAYGFLGTLYLLGYIYNQDKSRGIMYLEYSAMNQNISAQGVLLYYYSMVFFEELMHGDMSTALSYPDFTMGDFESYHKMMYWVDLINKLDLRNADAMTKNMISFAHSITALVMTLKSSANGADSTIQEEEGARLRKLLSQDESAGIYDTLHILAHLYAEGIGGPVNLKEAERLYQLGSDHNQGDAMLGMAQYYAKHGDPAHSETILAWFKAAAQHGKDEALTEIVNNYFAEDCPLTCHISHVFEALHMLVHKGDSTAEDMLLDLYADGIEGVVPNQDDALEALCWQIMDHNPKALFYYGLLQKIKRHQDLALEYVEKASAKGHEEAKIVLAKWMYADESALERPEYMWHLISLLRDICDVPDIQYLIGSLFVKQRPYIQQDYRKVKYWLEKAAHNKVADACYTLSVAYNNGDWDFPVDYNKALLYIEKAIELGYVDETNELKVIKNNIRNK